MGAATFLVIETVVLVLAAPVAGVICVRQRFRGVVWFAGAVGALLIASAAWLLASWGTTRGAIQAVVLAQTTVGAATMATGAVGAWFGTLFDDPLDAAACSGAVAVVAVFGLFAGGPLVANLPTSFVDAAMIANPIVAAASAANIDLLRTDLLYQVSPLAHGRFDYPAWYVSSIWYVGLMCACAAGAALSQRKGRI